jgi:hypothetical protein
MNTILGRRALLAGLLAAPLAVRDYSVLMPVKSWMTPREREFLANGFTYQNGIWSKRITLQWRPISEAVVWQPWQPLEMVAAP